MAVHSVIPFFFFGIILIFNFIMLGFWIWMLVDCLSNEHPDKDGKLIWSLVIALTGWIGGIIYFFVGRKKRLQIAGTSNYNK